MVAPELDAVRPGDTTQAGLWRRSVALVIDWAIASAISAGFFGFNSLATLVVFFGITTILVGTLGSTIGHRLCGIGVRGRDGALPGPLRALMRTAALCLVIPAAVWGADGRGLHDRWAHTEIVRVG
jgi:uncharacterized RDD family membrane protein YckC